MAGFSPDIVRKVNDYRLYVEDGNTPLTQCPYWMVEVGREIARARASAEAERRADREAKENVRQSLKAHGILSG